MKKTLSLVLSLMMILTTFTALPFNAFADEHPAASTIRVGDTEGYEYSLSTEKPYYKNNTTEATSESEGANVAYDESTGILTLNNYEGCFIGINGSGDVTVKLVGTSTINAWQFCINAEKSNLEITSDNNGVLNLSNQMNNSAGIVTQWGSNNENDLTISGNAIINYNTSIDGQSYGFRAGKTLSIIDNAKVSITTTSTKDYDSIYGLYASNIIINTEEEVSINLGTTKYYCYALFALNNFELLNVKKLSVIAYGEDTYSIIYPNETYETLVNMPGYSVEEDCTDSKYTLVLTKRIHTHTMSAVAAKAATCSIAGNNAYYKCADCEKYFKDAAGTQETTVAAETIAATGKHTSDKGTVTKKATPTATGTKVYKCTVCNKTIKTETIAKCAKYANPITVKVKTATVKFSKLKKKNQTVAQNNAFTISKAQGKVTYTKSSGNKKITVASNGKITIKKGLKKGTYKVKIKVTAAGNATYKAATKTVTVTIKVK